MRARLRAPGTRRASRARSRRLALALPDRRERVLQSVAAELVEHQQVRALAVVGAADQRDVALAGLDARQRDAHRIDAGGFLAHEGARGAGDAVHDRDIAGEQVGELRQEQRRPQVAHQPFVEEGVRVLGAAAVPRQDGGVDRDVALAAAGRDDHVRAREEFGVALDAGGVERKAGRIGADALPRLHLPLVALLRDLLVEVERRERMHDVGREGRRVGAAAGRARAPANARPALRRGRRRCRCR